MKKRVLSNQEKKLTELTSFFKRCQFCFELNALVIVKMNVLINEGASFVKRRKFMAIDTLYFQDAEEVFSHSVVVQIPNDGDIQNALTGMNIGDICDPFLYIIRCIVFGLR